VGAEGKTFLRCCEESEHWYKGVAPLLMHYRKSFEGHHGGKPRYIRVAVRVCIPNPDIRIQFATPYYFLGRTLTSKPAAMLFFCTSKIFN
jgi:hypothetical protein